MKCTLYKNVNSLHNPICFNHGRSKSCSSCDQSVSVKSDLSFCSSFNISIDDKSLVYNLLYLLLMMCALLILRTIFLLSCGPRCHQVITLQSIMSASVPFYFLTFLPFPPFHFTMFPPTILFLPDAPQKPLLPYQQRLLEEAALRHTEPQWKQVTSSD